ncbi:PAS domain S-box protein [Methanoregula sp.]|uniref:response regulator n=2 Tax=Methanoregula sp. TaxID=2052170 RepID=UPI003BAE3C00
MISILYVDDEPGMLDIGKLFLERGGQFSVDIITSAPAALTLLDSKKYDAVIADYQMPEMDGIEFLKRVRTSGNIIPFILFTGRGREDIVIQALNAGADFYLQKGGEPVSQFTELAHQVSQAVQQRRAEASIRDHERREADIINFLPDATFAIDTAGTVIAWNRAMEEMTGVKAAEILEKGNYEYAIPGYHERRPVLIDLVLHEDPAVEAHYPLLKRNGRALIAEAISPFLYSGRGATLRLIATPLFDNRGRITGAIESLRDITKRVKAEAELRAAVEQITAAEEELRSQYNELARSERLIRESEENFHSLVETAPDAIFIWVGETFVYVNPAMVRLIGAESADQLLGTSFYDRIHPSCHEGIRERARMVTEERKPAGLKETVFLKMDGTPIEIESAVAAFQYHNNPAGLVILRDVTHRKKADRLLRESEEKYRELVENANSIILKWDKTGNVTFLNEYAQRFFGYTGDEIIGKPVMGTIVPATGSDRDLSLMIEDIIRHPGDHTVNENENITKDGQRVWIRWQNKPLFDENGQFDGLFSIGTDITERRSAEKALRASEEHFRTLFENAPIGIFHSLPDGKFIDVNPAFARMLGYDSPEELIDVVNRRGIAETLYVTPEKRSVLVKEATESGKWQATENLYRRKDSSTLHGLLSFRSYINSSSGRQELEGFIVDISDRKVAEEALQASEIRFREQYQNNPLAILTWQHRDGDFVLIGYNKAAEALSGGLLHEFLGKTASELYEIRPEIVSQVRQCFLDRTVTSLEIVAKHFLPGRSIYSIAAFVPPDLVMVHMEDISGRKAAEEALREANKKLNLLYSVTRHDINNQLMALGGFIELLHEKIPDPALEYYFSWIMQAVNRIAAMIRFTKEYEAIGITAPLWQGTRTLVDTAAKQSQLGNITVKNDIPGGTEVFADPLIIKVFYNLMDNAVRYGGKITTIRFSWEEQNGKGIIVCEDDGMGILYADKDRIFAKGFGKNTGFGLFLAREVLSITGITIRETGEAGKGARFEMTIPGEAYRLSPVH